MKKNKLFECFNLDILESRDFLIEGVSKSSKKFLKHDLSILNEHELLSILPNNRKFTNFERKLIKFWACLFKSKELFEIGNDSKLTDKEFTQKIKTYIKTVGFTRCYYEINWKYALTTPNKLTNNKQNNIYENIALAMARSASLNIDLIEKLTLMGVNWNHTGIDDETVLINLCDKQSNLDNIFLLVSKNVEMNIRDCQGLTAFTHLCRNENITLDALKLFLNNGADMNLQDYWGRNAFIGLCRNRAVTFGAVQLLVNNGADTNIQDNCGATPFMHLCNNETVTRDLIQLFLDNGADMYIQDCQGKTVFMYLCENKALTVDMIQLFLDRGIDINFQDDFNRTAITFYLETGGKDKDILKLLHREKIERKGVTIFF